MQCAAAPDCNSSCSCRLPHTHRQALVEGLQHEDILDLLNLLPHDFVGASLVSLAVHGPCDLVGVRIGLDAQELRQPIEGTQATHLSERQRLGACSRSAHRAIHVAHPRQLPAVLCRIALATHAWETPHPTAASLAAGSCPHFVGVYGGCRASNGARQEPRLQC